MFATPPEFSRRREDILREAAAQTITPEEAGRRILEIDPDDPTGLMALGSSLMAAGDLEGAEPLFWRALAGAPSNPGYYLTLAALYRTRGDISLAAHLAAIATWKLSFYDEIPESLVGAVKGVLPDVAEDADSPVFYQELAEKAEEDLAGDPLPERLLPYRLLNEVQRQAYAGLDPDLIREIVTNAAVCAPLFCAAVHEAYDSMTSSLSHQAEVLVIALLGEIGGVELIDELLASGAGSEEEIFLHAQWAIRRLGQRFPAEAFACLQAAIPAAPADVRAAIAQQFAFLPDAPDRRHAVLATLDGFAQFAEGDEAPFLLLTVSMLLSMIGATADSNEVLKRHERQLPGEGRDLLRTAMDGDEPWIPELTLFGVDQIDLEGVCIDLALMEAVEDGEDDDVDDEFDEEAEEPVAIPKPGRNDPCWCGSGKKYKKCHLDADEQAARQQTRHDAEADLTGAIWNQLLESSSQYHRRSDVDQAYQIYFERDASEVDPESLWDAGFYSWYLLDYRAQSIAGRTVAEEFLRRRGARLTNQVRALLEAIMTSRFGLYEVVRVEAGGGVELKDLFEGDSCFVDSFAASRTLDVGDCVMTRIQDLGGKRSLSGSALLVGGGLVGAVRERVEAGSRETGLGAAEFFRSRSHEWRRFILDNQEDEFPETPE